MSHRQTKAAYGKALCTILRNRPFGLQSLAALRRAFQSVADRFLVPDALKRSEHSRQDISEV